jgi:hypothetical protein
LRIRICFEESILSHCLAVQHGSGGAFGGDGMMNPRRFAQVAPVLCATVILAGWVVAWLNGFGSASIENARAVPIKDHAPTPTAAALANAPLTTATDNVAVASNAVSNNAVSNSAVADATVASSAVVASADAAAAVEAVTVTGTAAATTAAQDEAQSFDVAALPDPSQILPTETPSEQEAAAPATDPLPNGARAAMPRIEIREECLVAEACIDQFLWALYQRTPKEDTIKEYEQRKVTVKVTVRKKRKTVTVNKTVTRTFTRLVDNDFTWKDPKAAERVGMPMMDYVIGGMDRRFKLKLFYTLYAAEQAGLSPGITSAFRDDYRQSIASGLKAASDRSYHGGSTRGGYGHGLAADIVSVNGATRRQRWVSTEILWKWIDANGKDFGIGRPYLDRDPPHVAPIDGKEYVSRRGPKPQVAEARVKKRNESQAKKRSRVAERDDRSAKRTNTAHHRKPNMRVAARR